MSERRLHIGLSLSPTWLRGSAWRLPDSGVEAMFTPEYAIDIAQRAEKARLDFLFRPDSLYLDPATLGAAPGFSALDPTVQMAMLAQATSHIGLVTTASTTFNPPYMIARQLQSLHWASNGRAGWNIVTSLDGERNFGVDAMPDAAWRYDRAREFVDVVLKLWDSYPRQSLVMDRKSGVFADVGQVGPIVHRGAQFSVEGPLTVPTHSAGMPPLFQAGASETGRDFAAALADAVFASTPDTAAAISLRNDLRQRAERHGRGSNAVRILPGLGFILAESRQEAREQFHALQKRQDPEKRYVFIENALGVDLRPLPHDAPIPVDLLGELAANVRSRTHAELLLRVIRRDNPTIADLLRLPESSGSAHWHVTGTPEDMAEAIAEWFTAGAMDGFVALPGTMSSLTLLLDAVVPILAKRGLFRAEYDSSTLAGHLGISPKA